MANTVQLKKNGQIVYPITDRACVIGLNEGPLMEFIYAWDGSGTPVPANIPAGVTVTYDGNTYTGTLAASASTSGYIYLVYNPTSTEYDRYGTDATGGSYAWKPMGDTTIQSPDIADNLTTDDSTKALSAKQGKILNEEVKGLEAKVDGNYTPGAYLNSSGNPVTDSSWGYSDYIPYTPGNDIVWRWNDDLSGYTSACIIFYKSDKVMRDYYTAMSATEADGGRKLTSSQVGSQTAYIRCSFKLGETAYLKINGVTVWSPDKGLERKVNKVENSLQELETTQTDVYHDFKQGTIDGNGDFINDISRCYCRIELQQNKTNLVTFKHPADFELSVVRSEDSGGTISTIISTADTQSFVGSNSIVAVIFVAKKTNNEIIPFYRLEELSLENTYSVTGQEGKDILSNELEHTESLVLEEELARKYDDADIRNSIREIASSVSSIEEGLENTYRAKGTEYDSATITLPHSNGGLYILNVHRKTNNGFDVGNNVYFPHAQKDFSDICVLSGEDVLSVRKIFSGNIDVIPDSRLPKNCRIYTDSNGRQYAGSETPSYSEDKGKTWTAIPVFSGLGTSRFIFLDSQDNLYVAKGAKLYRSTSPYSTYTEVLDFSVLNPSAIGIVILPENIVENPDTHRIFIGAYQQSPYNIHILYSDDYGVTWNTAYQANNYQHIHDIFIDTNVSPVAIYVGCDGGGGILKSTDNGQNWTDLRVANPNIPNTTDCGMVYCGNGYRVTGGETSGGGEYTLQKTTDDYNFTPVLSTGKGAYMFEKLGGKIFGGLISTDPFFTANIVMSEDECETWKDIYTLAPWEHSAQSDGFRYVSKCMFSATEEQIVATIQASGVVRNSVHILVGGNNYYAQFLVQIPSGISQIVVESGHFASKRKNFGNKYPNDTPLYSLPLNTGTDVLELDSNLIKVPVTPIVGGRQLGDIYPAIRSTNDMLSSLISTDACFTPKDLDLSSGNFHIGFWYRIPENKRVAYTSWSIYLIYAEGTSKHILLNNWFIEFGSQDVSIIYPGDWYGVWIRFDINVTSDGKFLVYRNGSKNGMSLTTMTDSPLSSFTANNFKVLYIPENGSSTYKSVAEAIQGFEITSGNITDEDAWNNYYGGLFDLQ